MLKTAQEIINQIQNYQIYKEPHLHSYYEQILLEWFNSIEREYSIETYYNHDDISEGQVITVKLNASAQFILKRLKENSPFVHETHYSVKGNQAYIQTFLRLHDIVNLFSLTTLGQLITYLINAPKLVIYVIDNKLQEREIVEEELPF